jgi:hypothetical protein
MSQFDSDRAESPDNGAEGPPLRCVHCGRVIDVGETFLPAGRCAMGGVVTGPAVAQFSDVLEPAGEHLGCAARVGLLRETPSTSGDPAEA